MTDVNQKPKLYSEKLLKYLESYSDRCSDITFIVGPQKQEIKSSRIILEAGCPRFIELFDEKWGQAVVRKNNEGQDNNKNGIPLPNADPEAFQLFIKLIISDFEISDSLASTDVNLNTILGTIDLCKDYGMNSIQQQLESFAQDQFFNNFNAFIETDDFLKLTKAGLGTILSLDDLCADEVLVFDAVCSWVEVQCGQMGVQMTGERIREILGDSLFKIRFPMMPMTDFCENTRLHDALTDKEKLQILLYMGLSSEKKKHYDPVKMKFSITPRNGCPGIIFDVLKNIPIVNDPGYICNGDTLKSFFQVSQNVEILGFGFLGPVISDAAYEVKIEIKLNFGNQASLGKAEKRVLAKQNKRFHVYFDQPICLNATYSTNPELSGNWYCIEFSLKGSNTSCPQTDSSYKYIKTENAGIELYWKWWNSPFAEVKIKKWEC